MSARSQRLLAVLDRTDSVWSSLSVLERSRRPHTDGWSPIELLGHLVDSASNNHERFVRAAFVEHLDFPGYDQDAWVAHQDYQASDWADLYALYLTLNRHLAHIMAHTPERMLGHPRTRHSLDRIAFAPRAADEAVTLGWFMDDYIDHLEHHLKAVPIGTVSE